MSLILFILKRCLIALPTLLLVSFISFTIMRFDFEISPLRLPYTHYTVIPAIHLKSPIDPLAELRQNPQISQAAYLHEKKRLGLDKPFIVQYGLWLGHILNFNGAALLKGRFDQWFQPDFGKSFSGEDVSHIFAVRIPNTLLLNVVTLLVTWLLALPLGILAALHWKKPLDGILTLLSSFGMAAPSFVVALLLAVAAVKLGWPPVGGLTSEGFDQLHGVGKLLDLLTHLVLPVTVLTIGGLAGLQRQMRGNLLDVLGADYVKMARAKGLPENRVIYVHAVRTAINPLITLMGYEFSGLLSGSALVEMVLRYPGLGFTALEAVRQTDTNLAMAVLLMGAALLLLGNLLADIALKWADPRVELS
jgi:peptide/nickel transport system permease protein